MGGGRSGAGPLNKAGSLKKLISNHRRAREKYGSDSGGGIASERKRANRRTGSRKSKHPKRDALALFKELSKGGRVRTFDGGDRLVACFKGGTVTYRRYSSSPDRSPAVDINFKVKQPGVPKKERIHFVKENRR